MGKVKAKKVYKSKKFRRHQLVEYLGNPDNALLNRQELASVVLGYKSPKGLYRMFSVDELCEIEAEALDVRRKKYGVRLAKVDQSLLTQAEAGDVAACKLSYQRFEGWSEKKSVDGKIDLNLGGKLELVFVDAKAPFDDEPKQPE